MRLLVPLLATSLSFAADVPHAYLRADPPVNPTSFYVEVGVPKALAAGATLVDGTHITLYQKSDTVLTAPVLSSITAAAGDRTRFRLQLPAGFAPEKDGGSLTVAIHDYPGEDGSIDGWLIPVAVEVKPSIVLDDACAAFDLGPYAVAITTESAFKDGYPAKRFAAIVDQLKSRTPDALAKVRIESRLRPDVEPRPISRFRFLTSGTDARLCLKTAGKPEAQKFDLEIALANPVAFEIAKPLLATDQAGLAPQDALRAAADQASPGSRTFERNLDASMNLTSSVKDTKVGALTMRSRNTQGTFDIRLAPLLAWQVTKVKRAGEPIIYWTPFFIDAKISNGPITKDALSLNRIVVGSEAELRTYYTTRRFPTYLRQMIRVSNASDRDFKQAEYKVGYEFQPYLGALNRPLLSNIKLLPNQLDKSPSRGPKLITETSKIGYELVPVFGAELGHTYTQRRPAAPFPGGKLVRRLYTGGQLTLNLTAYMKITGTERLYVRGEAFDRGRYHNYFSGQAEFPLGGLSAYVGQSLFFSFERGGQPPFATLDVNVIRLGYRAVSNGWFGRYR